MRISLRPNANFLRYTMTQDLKARGSRSVRRAIEVGVTKEGETFAAGAAATERPKCIVTGGQATMSVTFEGQTFPLCCSGCLGEFNDNPQKYVKKAALMLQRARRQSRNPAAARPAHAAATTHSPATSSNQRIASATAAKAKTKESPAAKKVAERPMKDERRTRTTPAERTNRPLPRKTPPKQPPPKRQREPPRSFDSAAPSNARARPTQALANYREVVKDYAEHSVGQDRRGTDQGD